MLAMDSLPDPAPALDRLAPVAADFHQASDQIDTLIATFNRKLAVLGIHLPVRLTADPDGWQVGWDEVDDAWQPATRWWSDVDVTERPDPDSDGVISEYEPEPWAAWISSPRN